MKARVVLLLFFLAGFAAQASLLIQIPSPNDDVAVRAALRMDPAVAATLETGRERWQTAEELFRQMPESELKKACGPPCPLNDSYVLPVSRQETVAFSGLGYQGEMKSYFLPVADLGGVLVFPYGDRDAVSAVALYLKKDATFVPLKKRADVKARKEWEYKKLDRFAAEVMDSLEVSEE